jgi:hypothetical protein
MIRTNIVATLNELEKTHVTAFPINTLNNLSPSGQGDNLNDIKKHEFSDLNFDGCEVDGNELLIYTSTHSDNQSNCNTLTLNAEDAAAIATHFGLTEKLIQALRGKVRYMKYRKKPVVINAIIYIGDPNLIERWMCEFDEKASFYYDEDGNFCIATLEDGDKKQAKHIADIGDYIIRGVQGEFYPCKPDIFEQTYEKV